MSELSKVQSKEPFADLPSTIFDMVEGQPRPKGRRNYNRDHTVNMLAAAGGLPYRGYWDSVAQDYIVEPHLEGATLLEAMVVKLAENAAAGDHKATSEYLDRILGKPKQQTETIQMSMSYAEYLDYLASDSETYNEPTGQTIDITPDKRLSFDLEDL